MLLQEFIFSEQRKDRVLRHTLFWVALAVYISLLQSANPMLKPASSYLSNLPAAFIRALITLIPQAFAAYTILYIVVPWYIRNKLLLPVVLSLMVIWVLCGLINIQLSRILPGLSALLLPDQLFRYTQAPPKTSLAVSLFTVSKGLLFGSGFLFMLHFAKQWYMKEQRNLQLQKENTESQLQLLTAQVHPQFLFNTLNHIYLQTQTESPKGSTMIMELADMLQYILAEGGKGLVPLKRELAMIQDYINLEKIRYGNKLDLQIAISGDPGGLLIAPLLLIPFVENAFKHGASKLLSSPWIHLQIGIRDRELTMEIKNGKEPHRENLQTESGTGIKNLRSRLALLYPGKYDLQIVDEPNLFRVNFRIELREEKQASGSQVATRRKVSKVGYA